MVWNTTGMNYLTVVKGVALFQFFCLVAAALFVGILIPDSAQPAKYSKTCLSASDGSSKCDLTENIFYSYIREVSEFIDLLILQNCLFVINY